MNQPFSLILDGDPGTDDLLAWMWVLAQPQRARVLGISAVNGNVTLDRTTANALSFLDHVGAPDIPVHAGAKAPLGKDEPPPGDGAFAESGLGDLVLAPSARQAASHDAVGWMAQTLRSMPVRTVTILATGPLTNLALLRATAPDAYARIGRIVAMGGSFGPLPPNFVRRGNVTPFAEFNFWMDAAAAQSVLNGGVPVLLAPADVTHQLISTPARLAAARALPKFGEEVARMLHAPYHLDKPKFHTEGAFLHDPTAVAGLFHPDLFETVRAQTHIVTEGTGIGAGLLLPDGAGNVEVMVRVKDTDAYYARLFTELAAHYR
ncbi:MAG: nucleoside hydrolase [Niveispirillum sp.]|uniref:nucleoside hydrolase n=1 Tax=Niveispirillum sp. TaxID=1917217 RepID=UPI0006B8AE8A